MELCIEKRSIYYISRWVVSRTISDGTSLVSRHILFGTVGFMEFFIVIVLLVAG